jgi:predicted transcriptional regulator of viral defense system
MKLKPANPDLELTPNKSLVRAGELAREGIAGEKLQQLLRRGSLVRVSRGLYAAPDRTLTEEDQLAQLAIRYPNLVFCLLTALKIHGLTTQAPHEVWIAISSKARPPSVTYPPLRIFRYNDPGLCIEQKSIDRVIYIPVTSVAKTIADCFKFRNKIGLDVALEALRDAWRQKKVTMDELWEAAQLCRVANVMRPYLESLV